MAVDFERYRLLLPGAAANALATDLAAGLIPEDVAQLFAERLRVELPPAPTDSAPGYGQDGGGLLIGGASQVVNARTARTIPVVVPQSLRTILGGTRWAPQVLDCGDDGDVVTKVRKSPEGSCANVSELVGTELMRAAGVLTFDSVFVRIPKGKFGAPQPDELHYGTRFQKDCAFGPPATLADAGSIEDALTIWVLDSWLCNIDRNNFGNTVLDSSGPEVRMLASDQSDCFGGAGRLSDGTWRRMLASAGAAESAVQISEALFAAGGPAVLERALDRARTALKGLPFILSLVPAAWWTDAGVSRGQLQVGLETRFSRLPEIVGLETFRGMESAIQGGFLLE